jgi:SlyX protein
VSESKVNESGDTLVGRVEELESQAAFQEELHDSLNTIVARQDGEILALKRQLTLLSERIKEFGEAIPGAGPQDETPPHY